MSNTPNPWMHLRMPQQVEKKPHHRGPGVHHGPEPKIHGRKYKSKGHPTERKRK